MSNTEALAKAINLCLERGQHIEMWGTPNGNVVVKVFPHVLGFSVPFDDLDTTIQRLSDEVHDG